MDLEKREKAIRVVERLLVDLKENNIEGIFLTVKLGNREDEFFAEGFCNKYEKIGFIKYVLDKLTD